MIKVLLAAMSMVVGSGQMNAQGWEWTRVSGGSSSDEGKGICVDATENVIQFGKFYGTAYFQGTPLSSVSTGYNWFLSKYDNNGNLLWVVNGLSGSSAFKAITEVTTDPDGNIYTTGFFSDTATIGETTIISSSYEDVFIAKFNASGALQWVRTGGGVYTDKGYDLVCDDAGKVYLVGEYQGTATFGTTVLTAPETYPNIFGMVLCYSNNGDIQYGKSYGSNGYNKLTSIDYLCLNLYLSGYLDEPSGGLNILAEKTDMSCNTVWSHQTEFNDDGNWSVIRHNFITANPAGVFLAGHFSDSIDFDNGLLVGDNLSAFACGLTLDGAMVWSLKLDSKVATVDGIETAGADLVLAGTFLDTLSVLGNNSVGVFDAGTVLDNNGFVLSLFTNGTLNWVKTIEPYHDAYRTGLVDMGDIAANSTDVFVSATFSDTITLWPWYPISFEEMDDDALLAKIDMQANAVDDFVDFEPQVFPSPATDVLNIVSDRNGSFQYTITDIYGHNVFSQVSSEQTTIQINIKQLPPAMYFITIESMGQKHTEKFIKQ